MSVVVVVLPLVPVTPMRARRSSGAPCRRRASSAMLQPGLLRRRRRPGSAAGASSAGLRDHRAGALRQGLGHEGGAIGLLALQGQEGPAGPDLAAVAGEVRHLGIRTGAPQGDSLDERVQLHGIPRLDLHHRPRLPAARPARGSGPPHGRPWTPGAASTFGSPTHQHHPMDGGFEAEALEVGHTAPLHMQGRLVRLAHGPVAQGQLQVRFPVGSVAVCRKRRMPSPMRLNRGAATSPPVVSPAGSSSITRTPNWGLSAGKKPMKEA